MERIDKSTLRAVAGVMASSFADDPMHEIILEGLSRKDELLAAHSVIHTSHALRSGQLRLLDGNPGAFLIGQDSLDQSRWSNIKLAGRIYLRTFLLLGMRDIRRIISNYKKAGSVVSFEWQEDFVNGRFFRIKIVAIDENMRGKGAFRRLVTPVLDFADKEKIPVVLETHNWDNVGLYEHFGFDLVKTIKSCRTQIEQYCMIRNPVSKPATC